MINADPVTDYPVTDCSQYGILLSYTFASSKEPGLHSMMNLIVLSVTEMLLVKRVLHQAQQISSICTRPSQLVDWSAN
jgi:hypothetical protein